MPLEFQDYIPIYKRLTDYYRNKIIAQEYEAGSRIDSINRIMDRHKVSRETAKKVIKSLIDENLVVSRAGKGTYVLSVKKVIKIWGMVIPFYSSNIEQLISEINNLAEQYERKLQYFLHYNNAAEEMRLVGNLINQGFEAIIVVPNYNEMLTAEFYRHLSLEKSKLVLADYTMAGSYFEYAVQSYDLGIKRAINYLFSANSGNILLSVDEPWQGKHMIMELIENTAWQIIASRQPQRKLFINTNLNRINKAYIQDNHITGILSLQDTRSIRILGRLQSWRIKVPDDVAIVSYGNTEITRYCNPPLTVLDCNYAEMARRIVQIIHNDPELTSKQLVILSELLVRET
ncbi:MAG: substrate-binding domain-containing protein [Bacteroidetes bacterium]|jgi:DNA-binding LacI/PurR family transcriptional regulator|nr:substrate-binding domain-containing protein [Bacteroidota bacterium]